MTAPSQTRIQKTTEFLNCAYETLRPVGALAAIAAVAIGPGVIANMLEPSTPNPALLGAGAGLCAGMVKLIFDDIRGKSFWDIQNTEESIFVAAIVGAFYVCTNAASAHFLAPLAPAAPDTWITAVQSIKFAVHNALT